MATAEGPQRCLYEILDCDCDINLSPYFCISVNSGYGYSGYSVYSGNGYSVYSGYGYSGSGYGCFTAFEDLFEQETAFSHAEFVKKMEKNLQTKRGEEKKAAQEKLQRVQREREEEEKAAQAKLLREKLEEEKLARARQYEEPEWARVADGVGEGEEGDGWYDDDDKGKKGSKSGQRDGNRKFYCKQCSKKFKSDKQWKNHEQSKKHKDREMKLRQN